MWGVYDDRGEGQNRHDCGGGDGDGLIGWLWMIVRLMLLALIMG